MNASVAIIEPSIDVAQLARDIQRGLIEYNDGERALQAAEQKTEGLRQQQQRRRLELGRLLIEAKSGIKHGGWLPYLEKLGIEDRRAREWMKLAGWMEMKSATSENVADLPAPTLRDAGIDKRHRKRDAEPDPPDEPDELDDNERDDDRPTQAPRGEPADEPGLFASWKRDISRALVGLDKMIMGYAKSWPKRSRSDLARTLRGIAERIENMAGD